MREAAATVGVWRLVLAAAVLAAMATLALAVNGVGPFAPAPPAPSRRAPTTVERMAQAPAIAGPWHDDHGYAYAFEQIGDRYSFRLLRGGRAVGGGAGRIVGHNLVHDFSSRGGAGSCTGTIDAAVRTITATCHKGDRALAFVLRRGGA